MKLVLYMISGIPHPKNWSAIQRMCRSCNIEFKYTNEIGEPHQIICEEEGDIFEVSTTHSDSDSYRVFKGDSQNTT